MPGAENLRDSSPLKMLLIRQAENQLPFGAICAAPAVILESYGLLKVPIHIIYSLSIFLIGG